MNTEVDVLIPTCNRPAALPLVLSGLTGQTWRQFRVIVSDQSDAEDTFTRPEFVAMRRYFHARGIGLAALRHVPRLGMAEQRAFLLAQAHAKYCLFLDDDVIVEPDLLGRLLHTIKREQCGFVGSALHGLSFVGDRRPEQECIEFWDDKVEPETVTLDSKPWQRHHLHSAANLYHLQSDLDLVMGHTKCYRVAWVGGCVLFDTAKLRTAGGFDFWRRLPPEHAGEDVLAQLNVMHRFGGCAIIPSGAYHMELPTTLPVRQVDAPRALWQ